MCFSAGASFTAGAVLSVAGAVSLQRTHDPSRKPFAAIPLLFAVQQLSEGVLWLALTHASYAAWQKPSMYFFLLFAQVIWPVWMPFSIYIMENDAKRRRWLRWPLAAGILAAAALLYRLLFMPVDAEVFAYHIRYDTWFPAAVSLAVTVLYLSGTMISLFISSIKRMRLMGVVTIVSLIIAQLFYTECLVSVWCFFAAVISLMVFYVLSDSLGSKAFQK